MLIEIFQYRISHAEAISRGTGELQQRDIHVGRGAMSLLAIAGIIDVAAGFELAAHVADHHHRPFPAARVMTLGTVAEVHDDRVIEHGAVSFFHRLELLHQPGDQVEVIAADDVVEVGPGLAFIAAAVADGVLVDVQAQSFERDVEILNAGGGG